MFKNALSFAFLLAILALVACQKKTDTQAQTAQDSTQNAAPDKAAESANLLPNPLEIKFEYERNYLDPKTGEEIDDINLIRETKIFALINGKRIEIDKLSMADDIEVASGQDYKIPADALAATGGWWAGAGDYIYLTRKGETISVMKTSVDEAMTEEDQPYYQYHEIKVITAQDLQ